MVIKPGVYGYEKKSVVRLLAPWTLTYDGMIEVLEGMNGSGKSTLLRLISQQYPHCLFLPEELRFPETLTGAKIMSIFGSTQKSSFETALMIDDGPYYQLSKGNRQKLRILTILRAANAAAVRNQERVVLLDEPTSGLDQLSQERFWCELEKYAQKYAQYLKFVVVTHDRPLCAQSAITISRMEGAQGLRDFKAGIIECKE